MTFTLMLILSYESWSYSSVYLWQAENFLSASWRDPPAGLMCAHVGSSFQFENYVFTKYSSSTQGIDKYTPNVLLKLVTLLEFE